MTKPPPGVLKRPASSKQLAQAAALRKLASKKRVMEPDADQAGGPSDMDADNAPKKAGWRR